MKRFTACLLALPFISLMQNASAVIHDNAPVVKLYKSCVQGGVTLDNCFSNTYTLTSWMETVRKPNVSAPLKVEMGPGEFRNGPGQGGGPLQLFCDPANGYTGYTHFQGAGMQLTVLSTNNNPIHAASCTHLEFSDFKITSSYHYINWEGGGESRWTNMEINTPGAAWTETACGAVRGKHYWFSSRLDFGTVASNIGYLAACDESWFFGSEINMNSLSHTAAEGFALKATDAGEIHVYGGNIRGLGVTSTPLIQAVNGGKVHIHGTGIDLEPLAGVNATLFFSDTGGMIHANSSAYSFKYAENSTITRIFDNGGHNVHAPYLWEGHDEPPSVISVTGADMSVITNTDDGQPHLVIYSSSCPGKWYDTVTKACH